MDRLKLIILSMLCVSACSKDAEPEYIPASDEILISVEQSSAVSKSRLYNTTGTRFSSGDKVRIYSSSTEYSTYKFRTYQFDVAVFQKIDSTAAFDITQFKGAFYPADSIKNVSFDASTNSFQADFGSSQVCQNGSFANGSAPMVCFQRNGTDPLVFKNCFAVLKLGFKYASTPENPLTVGSLMLSSDGAKINGRFQFTKLSTNDVTVSYVSGGCDSILLTKCDVSGKLGTTATNYFIALPPVDNGKVMTVRATPLHDIPFGGTFTTSATNSIAKNTILGLKPFVLNSVDPGASSTYIVDPWNPVDSIKVGQITADSTEVKIKATETRDVKINGVTTWKDITVLVKTGGTKISAEKYTDGSTYYVRIKKGSTGAVGDEGQILINDSVSNSAAYIKVKIIN